MIPLQEFLTSKTSIYSRSWIPTPWQVIKWSLRQLGMTGLPGSNDRLAVGQFVVVENIEVGTTPHDVQLLT
jgi:charged multivesicular body protein 7